jgi:hypothetical protein
VGAGSEVREVSGSDWTMAAVRSDGCRPSEWVRVCSMPLSVLVVTWGSGILLAGWLELLREVNRDEWELGCPAQ